MFALERAGVCAEGLATHDNNHEAGFRDGIADVRTFLGALGAVRSCCVVGVVCTCKDTSVDLETVKHHDERGGGAGLRVERLVERRPERQPGRVK